MINHNVVWFDITMHDAHGMAEIVDLENFYEKKKYLPKVKGFQDFENVITSIIISQCLIKLFEVSIVDVLKNQCWCTGNRVLYNVLKTKVNVWSRD